MIERCVNCYTEVQGFGFCPTCGLYVQTYEDETNYTGTLTVKVEMKGVDRDEAQTMLDRLQAAVFDLVNNSLGDIEAELDVMNEGIN